MFYFLYCSDRKNFLNLKRFLNSIIGSKDMAQYKVLELAGRCFVRNLITPPSFCNIVNVLAPRQIQSICRDVCGYADVFVPSPCFFFKGLLPCNFYRALEAST